ncbi:hypothetical protein AMTR_s00014p00117020 [Amborella trichopoda]|uniref:Uncharacterized protein n=1 Tax=Amborella trichopoda TaxID=13333 RepID=W1PGI3_AMBTC|nr:hypothetical protein AMTR_s00014p00117020 [Amborella trichopoda]
MTTSEVPAPTTSKGEPQSQPDPCSSKTLELVVIPIPEMRISIVLDVEALSKPYALSSEPSALVSNEPAIIAEIRPFAITGSSSLPFSMSNTITTMKTLLVETLPRSSLQEIKNCSLPDLAAKIVAVRDCATALGVLSYDKENFNWFEERRLSLFSTKEEKARLDIYIHQLKTKWDQKRVEARSKSQELETLNSEVSLTNTMSSQVTQAISHLKEQIKMALEPSEALKTKICEALENF